MNGLLIALQFLTILPIRLPGMPQKKDYAVSMVMFPVAGAVIGVLMAVLGSLCIHFFTGTLTNICVVVALAGITGGLHLDGLADTFDGIGARRDREQTLAIMRDSHIGTMGVLALIAVFMMKVYLLNAFIGGAFTKTIISAMVVSRAAMLIPLVGFPYARTEGKATEFKDAISANVFSAGIGIALAIAGAALHLPGLIAACITGAAAYGFCRIISRKIGGITGDVIGAVCELSEIVFLLAAIVLQ